MRILKVLQKIGIFFAVSVKTVGLNSLMRFCFIIDGIQIASQDGPCGNITKGIEWQYLIC